MRISLLVALPVACVSTLPALSGCSGGSDDTGIKQHGDGDADTDTDADSDADVGACGAYNPHVGDEETYGFTEDSGISGSYVVVFTSLDAGSGEAVFTSDATTAGDGYTSTSTTVQTLRCKTDGVYAVSMTTDYSVTAGGSTFGGTSVSTYDPVMLILPSGVAPGNTWDVDSTITTTDSNAGASSSHTSQTGEALAMESVTVPAGTYNSLPVVYTDATAGSVSHSWLAAGIGAVKTDSTELTAVQ